MNYKNITPPFSLEFHEMSKEELKSYYQWFMNSIPERIKILESAVQSTPGFENWKADFSVDSIELLDQWFSKNVVTRKKTIGEIKEIYANGPEWFKSVEIDDWELTIRTFSLAMDMGMYLSQVFLKNASGVNWYQHLKGSKNYAYYGQPVLRGVSKVHFNPIAAMVTRAYGFARGKKKSSLKEMFQIWKESLMKQ